MAVESRKGRPNRLKGMRGTRSGVFALLALSAGAGCGQSMLRPNPGPGLAARSLGQVNEDVPGRQLSWEDPGIAAARAGKPPTLSGLAPVGPISIDGITSGPPPSPMLATFDGSKFATTTWNGWKLPEPKLFGAAGGPVMASSGRADDPLNVATRMTNIAPPRRLIAPPGIRFVDDALVSACRESKIAPPVKRGAVKPAAAPNPGLDGLAAACRDTKIAPPKPKSVVAVVAPVVTPAAVEAPAPVAVAEAPKAVPVPVKVETPVAVAEVPKAVPVAAPETKVAEVKEAAPASTPAPAEAATMPLLTPTPTEPPSRVETASVEQKSEPAPEPTPAQAPKPAATETLESQAALPDRRPVRLPKRSQQTESTEAPLTVPTLAAENPPAQSGQGGPPLDETFMVTSPEPARPPEQPAADVAQAAPTADEASRVTNIELPRRPDHGDGHPAAEVTTEDRPSLVESLRVTEIEPPHRREPGTGEAVQAPPTLDEAARMTDIELPRRPAATPSDDDMTSMVPSLKAKALESAEDAIADTAVVVPPLESTPEPANGVEPAPADALKEASEATDIPPPIPARFPH